MTRIFALSDVHADYAPNRAWMAQLSTYDYQDDLLILAGDISDSLPVIGRVLEDLACRFKRVFYVPGNHEMWTVRDQSDLTSIDKFHEVCRVAALSGASTKADRVGAVTVLPLFGWYDYSFGPPGDWLLGAWSDFRTCRWPPGMNAAAATSYFLSLNDLVPPEASGPVVSFSHFLPRIDLMPERISAAGRRLYPVLGCKRLDEQLRTLGSTLHVYGHSHINRRLEIGGVLYFNNALGYPAEQAFTCRQLLCVFDAS